MFIRARAFAVHVFTAAGAAIALIVDGVDGSIARWLKVAEVLPRWSGDVLDLVVDFVTYVFVPAYAIAAGGLLPQPLALPAGIVVVVAGALYLFLLKPAPPLAAAIVVALAVLTFVPFKFLHPLRVARLRTLNIAALILWSLLALVAVLHDLAPGPWVAGGLVAIALYFLGVGLTEKR